MWGEGVWSVWSVRVCGGVCGCVCGVRVSVCGCVCGVRVSVECEGVYYYTEYTLSVCVETIIILIPTPTHLHTHPHTLTHADVVLHPVSTLTLITALGPRSRAAQLTRDMTRCVCVCIGIGN